MRKINDFENVDKEAAEFSEMIQNRKERYFYYLSVKLNNPQKSLKTYWCIIKSCCDGRKIPIIPSFSVKRKIIRNFKEKANLLKKYFYLKAILYEITVSHQKIKHILQKLNYHLSILRMKIYIK